MKWHTERQKSKKLRLESYTNLTSGHPGKPVTYDYEGDTYLIEDEEKKRTPPYMLRSGMGFASRRMRQGYYNG